MEDLRVYSKVKGILKFFFFVLLLSFLVALFGTLIWDEGKCVIAIIVIFILFVLNVMLFIRTSEIIDEIKKNLNNKIKK